MTTLVRALKLVGPCDSTLTRKCAPSEPVAHVWYMPRVPVSALQEPEVQTHEQND